MATVVLSEASGLKNQGIRHTAKIEWVKVVADSSGTGDGAAYTAKKLKSISGVVGGGPFSVTVSSLVATITPVITLSGTYFIGLVE